MTYIYSNNTLLYLKYDYNSMMICKYFNSFFQAQLFFTMIQTIHWFKLKNKLYRLGHRNLWLIEWWEAKKSAYCTFTNLAVTFFNSNTFFPNYVKVMDMYEVAVDSVSKLIFLLRLNVIWLLMVYYCSVDINILMMIDIGKEATSYCCMKHVDLN